MSRAVCRSFPPIADKRSKVLILGTMPGPEALRRGQYYGFPGNQFWGIISEVLGEAKPESYRERVRMLKRHRVALWDTLKACVRPGALDSSIRAPRPTDVPGLLKKFPGIRLVFVNGGGAQAYYKRFFAPQVSLHVRRLPSTSPAYASLSRRRKLSRWKAVAEALQAR